MAHSLQTGPTSATENGPAKPIYPSVWLELHFAVAASYFLEHRIVSVTRNGRHTD